MKPDCCWTRLTLASIHLACSDDSTHGQASTPTGAINTEAGAGKEVSVTGSVTASVPMVALRYRLRSGARACPWTLVARCPIGDCSESWSTSWLTKAAGVRTVLINQLVE
ncbi:hypothetical protein GCM10022243_08480 [Saccharothrix violaceirubra]